MKKAIVYPLFALVLLLGLGLACGDSNEGEVITTVSSDDAAPAEASPALEFHAVGEVIKVGEHTITMNSAEVSNGILKANFTIENQGVKEVFVLLTLSFEAKADDGTKLDQKIFDCGSDLNGPVLGGDKLRGDICWEGATAGPFKIYYRQDVFFGSGAVIWEVK